MRARRITPPAGWLGLACVRQGAVRVFLLWVRAWLTAKIKGVVLLPWKRVGVDTRACEAAMMDAFYILGTLFIFCGTDSCLLLFRSQRQEPPVVCQPSTARRARIACLDGKHNFSCREGDEEDPSGVVAAERLDAAMTAPILVPKQTRGRGKHSRLVVGQFEPKVGQLLGWLCRSRVRVEKSRFWLAGTLPPKPTVGLDMSWE